ncbi:uncharacterized protein C8A04DRAFT_39342 [Dichotomopilus funicola]|uniref:Zinc finger Mcm10/DnaG-type domain-containing protein n=1 Tax=Dichotomopilus funicola TaxID=1934379 RepID=A0AAN6ZJ38_9PEZI|nr:hypothetical protein C8A04DRAFT_39342 [Dichotomopilus funicola]
MAAQWPPRSPHDVLMSTPGGREKLRRIAERTSPSPSPSRLRTSRSMAALPPKPAADDDDDEMFEGGELDDEEDDEETLQLKLQAIQARLKLKKLKAAKALKRNSGTQEPSSGSGDGGGGIPLQSKLAVVRDRLDKQQQQQSRNSIEVPASPTRRPQSMTDLQTSPRRVLLGIDKGLRGADVSLKRAPIQRSGTESRLGQQQGGVLQRAKSPLDAPQRETKRPLSFNERLASARTEEIARKEKRERAQNARTTAFSVGKQEMEEYKTKAQDLPELPSKPQEFSRDQILSSMGKPPVPQLQRSRTLSDLRSGTTAAPTTNITNTSSSFSAATNGDSGAAFEPYSGLHLSKRILPHNVLARAVSGKKSYLLKDLLRQVKAPDWSLPDDETDIVVFAIVASKSDPRDHRPGPGGNGKAQQDRGKYMVITLVDLTYEVDLFLFNTGFDRFWKLTPGTIVAILNPNILPPVPGREATNRFGLTINSDADTILEIGSARDLGYCKSIKKDGTYCKSWVNSRRTEYCEYHTNEAVRKARSSRVELSSTAGFGGGDGPRGRANSRRVFAKSEEDRQRGNYDRATQSQYFISTAHRSTDPDDERLTGIADRKEREEHLKRRLAQKEKERDIARRLGEMGGGAGRDYMTRAASRASGTTSRAGGGGPGSSFSSVTTSFSSAPPPASSATTSATSFGSTAPTPPGMKPDLLNDPNNIHQPRKWDARALGLIGRRGSDQPKVSLAPPPKPSANGTTTGSTAAKRKRPESSGSSFSSNSAGQQQQQQQNGPGGGRAALSLGWGSNLRDKLGRMKEGLPRRGSASTTATASAIATRRGDTSPVRKKTRFVTDRGIKEAGRESLGETLTGVRRRVVVVDQAGGDEDDLVVLE